MFHSELKRKQNETITDYKYRICKDRELLGLDNWQEVANILNRELEQNWSESTYRKWFSNFESGVQYAKEKIDDDDYLKEIKDKTLYFQKERIKFQDQKREYTNIVRQQARFEHLKDEIHIAIAELTKLKPLIFEQKTIQKTNKKAIALWSDWHVGSEFENSLNAYNLSIFEKRVQKLLNKTIEYSKINNVDEIYVGSLGDMISGAIHVSTRVQASEDVIRQVQIVSEIIAQCIAELANNFNKIKLINIIGNHSRLISDKTQSIFTENLENLVPWYLESRLKEFKNVEIAKDQDGYYIEESFGDPIVFVHGDLDSISSVAKTLPQMLGIVPKYVFAGHIHHNTVKEYGKTTVVTNGSLMGVDTYAISKRFYAEPMQKLMIMDGSDVECTYDIKLIL